MTDQDKPPYLWAFLSGLTVFVIYTMTLAPTTAFWDTSEYIAAAKVLGIPHPPGNPLFVMMAHAFGLLPVSASYAMRINLFAAFTSAVAAGFWFLVAERWLRNLIPVVIPRRVAAFAGVLVGATMWTVWNQSTVNEKVYTISLMSTAIVTWLVVHWGDDVPGPHRDRWLILIAYVTALSSTNHMMGVLAAPAVAVYVLWTDWRVVTRPWVLLAIAVVVVIGLTPNYLFLPIRAGQHPAINEGEPIGFFSQALMAVLNREQYGKPPLSYRNTLHFHEQLQNYWEYFSWQFARDWNGVARVATAFFTVVGLAGLYRIITTDRRAGIAAATMLFTLTIALVFYLNFKYSYGWPDPLPPPRANGEPYDTEVRERDYFFLVSFSFFGTLVAAGIGAMMRSVADALKGRLSESGRWYAVLPLGLVAMIPLLGNRLTASRANEYSARALAHDLLESVEPYGILITAGDNDTFPLWYAQEVEGIRRDVTVANTSLMRTDWHLKQLARRKVPTFDPSKSTDMWKTGSFTKPESPPLLWDEKFIEGLDDYFPAPAGVRRIGNYNVRFATSPLSRDHIAILQMMRDNAGKRSIYFSWTVWDYPDQFGLAPYLVSDGLVRKLYPDSVVPADSLVFVPQAGGWWNTERTKTLLSTYAWKDIAGRRPRGWIDDPSKFTLDLYQVIYAAAAVTFTRQGDSAFGSRADSIARAIAIGLSGRATGKAAAEKGP